MIRKTANVQEVVQIVLYEVIDIDGTEKNEEPRHDHHHDLDQGLDQGLDRDRGQGVIVIIIVIIVDMINLVVTEVMNLSLKPTETTLKD
jgi:hypothetical protein